jgi:putative Mn2+ efflux pump MntP
VIGTTHVYGTEASVPIWRGVVVLSLEKREKIQVYLSLIAGIFSLALSPILLRSSWITSILLFIMGILFLANAFYVGTEAIRERWYKK